MGTIFDGIQRPLEQIFQETGKVYVPKGVDTPCLTRDVVLVQLPRNFPESSLLLLVFVLLMEFVLLFLEELAQYPKLLNAGRL